MKSSIFLFLVFGVALFISGCSEDNSLVPGSDQSDQGSSSLKSTAKPSANLTGEMDLYFDLTSVPPTDPVWVGTIDFEGYGTYGMRFFHLSPFRDYSQASPFEEYFEIYDLTDATIVLAGPDVGVTTLANKPPEPCKYRMNGEIDVAAEPFEGWLGRHVHMSGMITWQIIPEVGPVPATAPGIFRIN
jgi:hypothetical protein